MRCRFLAVVLATVLLACCGGPSYGQLRIEPDSSPTSDSSTAQGTPIGEPWANVLPTFHRSFEFPEWPVPTELSAWRERDRANTLREVLDLLGDLPPRLSPPQVKTTRTEDRGDHLAEYFALDSGFDMMITGLLLLPKGMQRPAPAIIAMHGWSGDKDNLLSQVGRYDELVGPALVRRGYVVAAIDGCFHGDRIGKGPNDIRTLEQYNEGRVKQKQEAALYGLHIWFGRTLFGMMVREQQCLIDYLQTRPEVDPGQIGATGMSLGNTTSFWLTAIDPRVRTFVGVACFSRLEQMIKQGYVQNHGRYYFLPGMLKHFDTEAVLSLVAPRPMLQLNGDGDGTCPLDGIEILERKVGAVYQMYEQPGHFQSVVYRNTGHVYLPDMKRRMVSWFTKHMPPAPRNVR